MGVQVLDLGVDGTWDGAIQTFTTDSVSPAANSLLVLAIGAVEDFVAGDMGSLGSASGGGLTWTRQANITGSGGDNYSAFTLFMTAQCGASPGTFAVTYDFRTSSTDGCSVWGWVLFEVTGHDTGTPFGGTATGNATNGDQTITLSAAPASGDYTFAVTAVDAGGGSGTTGATPASDHGTWTTEGNSGEDIAVWIGHRTGSTDTAVHWSDVQAGSNDNYTGAQSALVVKMASTGVTGTITATETADSTSFSGTVTPPSATGTITATEVADSTSFTGSVAPAPSGTIAATEVADSTDFTGQVAPAPSGTITATETADTTDFTGSVTAPEATGTITAVEVADTTDFTGTALPPTVTGTITATEVADTNSASGTFTPAGVTGTITTTEGADSSAARGVTRPFVKAVSGRRFVDHFGNDILLRCWSSWGLAQNLSNADITTHLEGVQARGFDAVSVMLFGYDLNATWDPYVAGNGSAVFTGTPYNSSLGTGWGSMDHVVAECGRLGLTAVLSLYSAFGTTGPAADMVSAGSTAMHDFGYDVATRYLDAENIVWHYGADDTVSGSLETVVRAFFDGINDAEGINRRIRVGEPANGSSAYEAGWFGWTELNLSANSWYEYGDTSVDIAVAGFNETGATSYPVWDCEPPYRWAGHYGSTTTVEPQEMRERIYATFFQGGVGINEGDEDSWPFGATGLYSGGRTWQQTLTDPHAYWCEHAWDVLALLGKNVGMTRGAGSFLTSGLGTGDTKAAVCYDASKAAVYMPTSRSLTVDLTTFSAGFTACRVDRIDPTTGTTTTVGTYATTGSQVLGAPGDNNDGFSDWVYLFEGENTPVGTITATDGTDSSTFTGTVAPAPSGTITATEAADSSTMTGTAEPPLVTGTVTATEGSDLSSFAGTVAPPPSGTIVATEQTDVSTFTGEVAPPPTGTIAVTEAADSATFSGTVTFPEVTGTIVAVEAADSCTMTGSAISGGTGNPADVWNVPLSMATIPGTFGHLVKTMAKVLLNRTETDPVLHQMRVYDDDDVTVALSADLFEDIAATQGYRDQGADRRNRLEPPS